MTRNDLESRQSQGITRNDYEPTRNLWKSRWNHCDSKKRLIYFASQIDMHLRESRKIWESHWNHCDPRIGAKLVRRKSCHICHLLSTGRWVATVF